jgi:superfamily II DNA or RNA helicase
MTDDRGRRALQAEISEHEALLTQLESDRERARARLAALRAALVTLESPSISATNTPDRSQAEAPTTSAEKVALFRSLFRGRTDVFPRLWTNPRKGTKGYAPACHNEWVRGVCEKPRIKCSECSNQAFVPVDDQVILDHLQGRQVIGIYPLLEDDTCWFLAADFDGPSWTHDVAAFVYTCRSVAVPVAVERSRSGDGAHAWFFFTAPVPASVARAMGCYLITETMSRRHQLGMESYDRLFPNQDTRPRGGFGNLIALPLQHEARQRGHTVFLDEDLEPVRDQWAYLASVSPMDPAAVEAIAREATRSGQVIGVRQADVDSEDTTPWERQPSGQCRPTPIQGSLPSEIRAVLAQRLFVETAGLPSPLLNQIKRLAAFQNPEFYARQRMRLSTAITPRVIACAEDLPQHVALPRGCLVDLEAMLREYGVHLLVDDQRHSGEGIDVSFTGELTDTQQSAAKAMLEHDIGILVAPSGIGKTVLGTYLIAQRARNSLILVHRQPLLDQWITQLSMFLAIDAKEVGRIGGGARKPNGRLDVAMIQSLVRKERVDDIVATYGHVVVDECHHVPAVSFEHVLSEVKARYIVGLTATPHRRDGHHPILAMQLGPVRFSVAPNSRAARRPFASRLIVRETAFQLDATTMDSGIQKIYGALAADADRNALILDDVIRAVHERRSPILLTERRDHLEYLAERLRGFVHHLVVLKGGMGVKERRAVVARLAELPDHEERLILATGRYIGEGFDDTRLDTLFLAFPVSWKGTLLQYAGRLHRLHPKKTEVQTYDYADINVPMLHRMFDKRLRTYRALGYAREGGPLDDAAPARELTLEYDEYTFDDSVDET